MKARYLTFFSYIGTAYRSSEKLWLRSGRNYPDPESVQGMMEIALLRLRSLNYPNLFLSSRTDGGVHALHTSAHFDLDRRGTQIYNPDNIAYQMNRFFFKNNSSIYVKKCIRVSDKFNARFMATSRTYLYRFAVLKHKLPDSHSIGSYIPVEEWKRCHYMRLPEFDIEKFKEGAKYFIGYHDFTTFKKFNKMKQHKHNRRDILSLEVRPGRPLLTSYSMNQENIFEYWDVEIKGRGFVHNQIRRMIGALRSVAIGQLPAEEIKVMLQIPSKNSWHSFILNCPPDGLYLCNVEYNPEDLIYNLDIESKETEDKEIEHSDDSDSE